MSYDEDIDAFTITREREIIFYLNQLINDREPLSVLFNDGQESMLTMAIHVDEDEGQLFLDWGGSESVNQLLLKTDKATFVANPLGVRNQFHTGQMHKAMYNGRPAFVTAIPKKYVRLQRREYFRLTLPGALRMPCRFHLDAERTSVRWLTSVIDIGVGGVCLESATVLRLAAGHQIIGADIDFGKHGIVRTDLEVRHSRFIERATTQVTHIGCQFTNLSRSDENTVQRFITKVQADERAKFG